MFVGTLVFTILPDSVCNHVGLWHSFCNTRWCLAFSLNILFICPLALRSYNVLSLGRGLCHCVSQEYKQKFRFGCDRYLVKSIASCLYHCMFKLIGHLGISITLKWLLAVRTHWITIHHCQAVTHFQPFFFSEAPWPFGHLTCLECSFRKLPAISAITNVADRELKFLQRLHLC